MASTSFPSGSLDKRKTLSLSVLSESFKTIPVMCQFSAGAIASGFVKVSEKTSLAEVREMSCTDCYFQAGRDGRAALKIALTTDRNNQAEARGTAVGALKSDLARRLEDVQALGEAVQTKIAALAEPQNEDQHERLVKDLGDMQAMVRRHNRRIRELQQTRKVQVTYQRTRTSRQTVLEPGVPCRVPFLLDSELLVMWCPIVLRTEGAH